MKEMGEICISLAIIMSASFCCFAQQDAGRPIVKLVTGEGYYPFVDKDIVNGGFGAFVFDHF